MHELSIVYDLVEQVESAAVQHKFKKVNRIELLVGEWSGVDPEALEFCFPEATRGTCLESAQLMMTCKPLTIECSECHGTSKIAWSEAIVCAHCGSTNYTILEGKELKIVDLDVD